MPTFRKVHALLTRPQRLGAVALLGLMVVGMVLETLSVGLVVPAIALLVQDDLTTTYPGLLPVLEMLGQPTQAQLVAGGMITLVFTYVFKTIYLGFMAWRQMLFVFGVQADLSQKLFTTYLLKPYTFHLQRNSAQLVLNVINEVQVFTGQGMLPGMLLITEALVIIGVASLLLSVEPAGALAVFSILGLAAWGFNKTIRDRVDRSAVARQHHDGMRLQHLQQGLAGTKDVKMLGREEYFLGEYRRHNLRVSHVGQQQQTLQQLPRLLLELLAVVGLAVVVLTSLAQGHDIASIVPTVGLFGAAAFRLMPSVNRVLNSAQSLRYVMPAVDMLSEELSGSAVEPEMTESADVEFKHAIELADLCFSYPGAHAPALKGLCLKIRKGECIGFIGSSGAGKSTLVDVILGLLEPTEGYVSVDGEDIQRNLRGWQNTIGYVPQSIYLTDDTLRRNVAFGLPDNRVAELAVQRAIRAAQLDEFVASLPDGLDTVVGERGVRLSGGQRQRIGIARALYHDPSVLVLDEATSALDMATEHEVMQAVMALQRRKTIIVVAHRLSTVERCDRLYQLEHGRVVAEGATASMLRGRAHGSSFVR